MICSSTMTISSFALLSLFGRQLKHLKLLVFLLQILFSHFLQIPNDRVQLSAPICVVIARRIELHLELVAEKHFPIALQVAKALFFSRGLYRFMYFLFTETRNWCEPSYSSLHIHDSSQFTSILFFKISLGTEQLYNLWNKSLIFYSKR